MCDIDYFMGVILYYMLSHSSFIKIDMNEMIAAMVVVVMAAAMELRVVTAAKVVEIVTVAMVFKVVTEAMVIKVVTVAGAPRLTRRCHLQGSAALIGMHAAVLFSRPHCSLQPQMFWLCV